MEIQTGIELERLFLPVTYFAELRQLPLVVSVNACLLMARLEYYFGRQPKGFTKFIRKSIEPFQLSWNDELGFKDEQFRKAFSQIGVAYRSPTRFKNVRAEGKDVFGGKYYLSVYSPLKNRTHYFRNHEVVDIAIRDLRIELSTGQKRLEQKMNLEE